MGWTRMALDFVYVRLKRLAFSGNLTWSHPGEAIMVSIHASNVITKIKEAFG